MKKLLILGATYHEIDIIKRAHSKGIYVIVTDNNLDWSKSPAKYIADEAWNISWSDIDTLTHKCQEVKVNGVIAGFSEFRVENMIKLCERLCLSCTLSMEQLDITRDKIKFKTLCAEYGIQGVPEYKYGDNINFPVIIKPVDRAGSIGINVAHNEEEFEEYYKIAYDLSPSKCVIIEDFIDDGIKVDFYYYVKDGDVYLLGTSDTVMCEGELGAPILQKAWIFPSQYEAQYISEDDPKIRQMLLGIGVKNGYTTMSAFYRNGKFYFFEAGFRLSGELSYNFYNRVSGINYIDTLIDYSLGISNSDKYEDYYSFDGKTKSVILNYFGINGIVKNIEKPQISGIDEAEIIEDFYIKEGDCIENKTSVFKKIAMYTILSDDCLVIKDAINHINSNIRIQNNDGVDLIYEKVDENSLGLSYDIYEIKGKQVKIMQKPYWVLWKDIQLILNEAHQTNISQGLVYATYNQSIAKLREKTKNSICLVAFVDDKLAATATVQFRSINHWYHSGEIGLLKLLGVTPTYRGYGLASLLTRSRLALSANKKVLVVVTDSAEQNVAVRHLYLSEGFKIVDCCKYPENSFVSVVYAKWLLTNTPFTDEEIETKYLERRKRF